MRTRRTGQIPVATVAVLAKERNNFAVLPEFQFRGLALTSKVEHPRLSAIAQDVDEGFSKAVHGASAVIHLSYHPDPNGSPLL